MCFGTGKNGSCSEAAAYDVLNVIHETRILNYSLCPVRQKALIGWFVIEEASLSVRTKNGLI